MADRITEIVHLVRNVCEEENLRVTLKNSLKNGLAAGIGGTIGCILGGPWGGVPGAAIGAAVAATIGEEFKPLAQVIAEWPDEAKQHLADNIESIMRRVDARDVATLAAMIAGATPALRAEIIAAVVDFCQNEMSLQITGR
ncbi:protein C19orf12 homolog [Argiope bruennichi]|uniref:Protein C19orf12 like protein n=1 Tax=Argiope bruennichi TaxID=94029 RepID=A0A8T0ELY7_ARGBR|nr:protein C19orf12 homolog [Argiope bruennichi]XP_055950349.1 protein C19orf12 homolog [Argiope bruennichi]KAF8774434.1 Protein C19orf12 like protein [Argiope bruennichi]